MERPAKTHQRRKSFMLITASDRIFFNGDSITDAGRDRGDFYSLAGYTKLIADRFTAEYAGWDISCYNRGISGNRSKDVLERIEGELAQIRPTVFCMLIGINDVWRRYDSGNLTSGADYGKSVAKILDIVKKYTGRIMVLEPFLIYPYQGKESYYEDLYPKILELRKACYGKKITYVPLDGIFAAKNALNPAAGYSGDAVHLTDEGNKVVAEAFFNNITMRESI